MDNYFQLLANFGNFTTNEDLINNLKTKFIEDNHPEIINALMTIPRGDFIPLELSEQAYHDSPIRFSRLGFNISAPHIYINCLAELDLKPSHRFLDIGSGCGHFTCLAGYLVGPYGVSHGLEISEEIIQFSQENLNKFTEKSGIDLSNVEFKLRNCFLPDKDNLVYDRIYVGSSCPRSMLNKILNYLAPNGILIVPISDELRKYQKNDKDEYTKTTLLGVRYSDLQIPTDEEIENATFLMEREKKLRVQIPNDNISNSFKELLNNESEFNLIFITNDQKKIHLHKIFFRIRSPKFYQTIEEQTVVELPIDFEYENVLLVLEFLYSGVLPKEVFAADQILPLKEKLENLITIAKYLELEDFVVYCESLLDLYKSYSDPESDKIVLTIKDKKHFEQERLKAFDKLSSQMLDLSTSSIDSDIILSVGGSKISCHKLILKTRSKFFKSFFTSGMKETYSQSIEIFGPFELCNFIEYIRFIYSGDSSIINNDNVLDILCISDYFNENCLKCMCEDFLIKALDDSNVSTFLQASSSYNANQLAAVCMEKIFENFESVSKTESFKQLDKDLVVNCLSECCKYFRRAVSINPNTSSSSSD